MQVQHGLRFGTRPDDRLPVRIEDGRQALLVGLFGHRHRREAALGVATDLLSSDLRIREEGDAEGHDAIRVGAMPLLEEPVVPCTRAGEAELGVVELREEGAAEARDPGREIHRRPHAVDVHVLDAVLDLVAARSHLIEARRLDPVVFLGSPGDRHEAHLEVRRVVDRPDFVAFLGFDHARRASFEFLGHAPHEGVRRLHQVIVDGEDRVLLFARLRIRQQRPRGGALDSELDDARHGGSSNWGAHSLPLRGLRARGAGVDSRGAIGPSGTGLRFPRRSTRSPPLRRGRACTSCRPEFRRSR